MIYNIFFLSYALFMTDQLHIIALSSNLMRPEWNSNKNCKSLILYYLHFRTLNKSSIDENRPWENRPSPFLQVLSTFIFLFFIFVFIFLFQRKEWPVVTMALFVQDPTPFVADFLDFIANLDYPKARIILFLYSHVSISLERLGYLKPLTWAISGKEASWQNLSFSRSGLRLSMPKRSRSTARAA